MDCPLYEAPMAPDLRYKLQDAFRCVPCGVQIRAPKGATWMPRYESGQGRPSTPHDAGRRPTASVEDRRTARR